MTQIGGWERQGLIVRFLALGSEGAFDPEAHPRFLSRMILCSFQDGQEEHPRQRR